MRYLVVYRLEKNHLESQTVNVILEDNSLETLAACESIIYKENNIYPKFITLLSEDKITDLFKNGNIDLSEKIDTLKLEKKEKKEKGLKELELKLNTLLEYYSSNIEQPYIDGKYNPNYGDNRICNCGHVYERHFDSYEDNEAVGCKYCNCFEFKEMKNISEFKGVLRC